MSWTITPSYRDPNYSSVSLLLHGNGVNGSTAIIDNSPTPRTVTAVGNAQISTAQSKFGGSSIAFDGNGDYLELTANSIVGVNDFTVEAWIYIASLASDGEIFCIGPINDLASFNIVFEYKTNGALRGSIQTGSGGAVNSDLTTSAGLLTLNTWSHVAMVANGATLTLYINGALQGTAAITGTRANNITSARIGRLASIIAIRDFNGYIDDLRITKGVARYTGNFSVPPAPFPDI